MFDFDRAKRDLDSTLSERRLKHSYSVRKKAAELALRYGEDVEKAEIAALFHDFAKEYSVKEINSIIEKMSLNPEIYRDNNALSHGPVAAYVLKEKYFLDDAYILDAIFYHTFGRGNMTGLDKIIFLADVIEDDRNYEGVDLFRLAALHDLDLAVMLFLRSNLLHLLNNGAYIHPDSVNMYNSYLEVLRRFEDCGRNFELYSEGRRNGL